MSYVKHFKRLNGAFSLAVLRTVTTDTAISPIFTKKEPALEADPCLFIAFQYEEECERLFIVAKIQDSRRLNECSAQRKMRPRVHKYPEIFENGFFFRRFSLPFTRKRRFRTPKKAGFRESFKTPAYRFFVEGPKNGSFRIR